MASVTKKDMKSGILLENPHGRPRGAGNRALLTPGRRSRTGLERVSLILPPHDEEKTLEVGRIGASAVYFQPSQYLARLLTVALQPFHVLWHLRE
jgi:hypothetical protein